MRVRDDLCSDGSRIEGSHKGWNSLQRSFSSGIEMINYLAHDFVLRRNIRVTYASKTRTPSAFVKSSHGSHHVRLLNSIAHLWNTVLGTEKSRTNLSAGINQLVELPVLPVVESGETFGMVASEYTTSFKGLYEIKEEAPDNEMEHLLTSDDLESPANILRSLNIDPNLLDKPQQPLLTVARAVPNLPNQALVISALPPPPPVPDRASAPLEPASNDLDIIHLPLVNDVTPSTAADTSGPAFTSLLTTKGGKKRKAVHLSENGDSEGESPVSELTSKKPRSTGLDLVRHSILKSRVSSRDSLLTTQSDHSALQTFFKETKRPVIKRKSTLAHSGTPSQFAAAVPPAADIFSLPVGPELQKLTKSQRLFSLATKIDVRSLKISTNPEFYLFMEMRSEQQWTSFKMTSRKWVTATDEYNKRLEDSNKKECCQTFKKNPRALLDKLIEVEVAVLKRIVTQNFACKCVSTSQLLNYLITFCSEKKFGHLLD